MTPEGKAKAGIKKVLAEYDCWYFMPSMNGYGRSGIPDFVGCYKGQFFAIEAKAQDGKLTPNQEREAVAIHTAGGRVLLARGGDVVREMLDAIALQCQA